MVDLHLGLVAGEVLGEVGLHAVKALLLEFARVLRVLLHVAHALVDLSLLEFDLQHQVVVAAPEVVETGRVALDVLLELVEADVAQLRLEGLPDLPRLLHHSAELILPKLLDERHRGTPV